MNEKWLTLSDATPLPSMVYTVNLIRPSKCSQSVTKEINAYLPFLQITQLVIALYTQWLTVL